MLCFAFDNLLSAPTQNEVISLFTNDLISLLIYISYIPIWSMNSYLPVFQCDNLDLRMPLFFLGT